MKHKNRGIKHVKEAVITASLFAFQIILVGLFKGIMFFPLAIWIFTLLVSYPEFLEHEIYGLLPRKLLSGRIVAVAGFVIFLVACIHPVPRKTWKAHYDRTLLDD